MNARLSPAFPGATNRNTLQTCGFRQIAHPAAVFWVRVPKRHRTAQREPDSALKLSAWRPRAVLLVNSAVNPFASILGAAKCAGANRGWLGVAFQVCGIGLERGPLLGSSQQKWWFRALNRLVSGAARLTPWRFDRPQPTIRPALGFDTPPSQRSPTLTGVRHGRPTTTVNVSISTFMPPGRSHTPADLRSPKTRNT